MKIKDVIEGLQKPLRIPEDVDFRVGSTKSPKGVTVLAYKDARVDMRRLDEVTNGQWQNDYQRDSNGALQCGISIYCEIENTYQWIKKVSNGSESNQDAEKGQYSDAFKRAGFMWGIGRELYDMPFIFISYEGGEDKFNVLRNMEWKIEGGYLVATKNNKQRFKGKLGSVYVPDEVEQPKKKTAKKLVINPGKETLAVNHKKYCKDSWKDKKSDVKNFLSKKTFTSDDWKEITGTEWVGGTKYPVE